MTAPTKTDSLELSTAVLPEHLPGAVEREAEQIARRWVARHLSKACLVIGFVLCAAPLVIPLLDLDYHPTVQISHLLGGLAALGLGLGWHRFPPRERYVLHAQAAVGLGLVVLQTVLLLSVPQPLQLFPQYLLMLLLGTLIASTLYFAILVALLHVSLVWVLLQNWSDQDWRVQALMSTLVLIAAILAHLAARGMVRLVARLDIQASRELAERKRLQDRLFESEKVESLGRLAGGVAHDFNNLLTPILAHAELLAANRALPEPQHESADQIREAARRAALLTDQLLSYASRTRERSEDLDLAEEVQQIVRLAGSSLPERVTVEFEPPDEGPTVRGDRGQLQQVALNLILNAGDALKDSGGSVRVSVDQRRLSAEGASELHPPSERSAGTYARLIVEDRGEGIDPETLRKIFDPFFSTKAHGRGLGLSTAVGIASRHGGGLRVRSRPGRGTRFELLVPGRTTRRTPRTSTDELRIEDQTHRVLLVDDEESVRRAIAEVLSRSDFEVLEAPSGERALEIYSDEGEKIELVVLDLRMPGLSGRTTLRRLRSMNRALPVLICSGYGEGSMTEELRSDRRLEFIHKPFEPQQLVDRLRRMLRKDAFRRMREQAAES